MDEQNILPDKGRKKYFARQRSHEHYILSQIQLAPNLEMQLIVSGKNNFLLVVGKSVKTLTKK
jgi:hypothetical protein